MVIKFTQRNILDMVYLVWKVRRDICPIHHRQTVQVLLSRNSRNGDDCGSWNITTSNAWTLSLTDADMKYDLDMR